MYALCVSGAVNTQGFVWKFFLCAIYKFSFIHSFTVLDARHFLFDDDDEYCSVWEFLRYFPAVVRYVAEKVAAFRWKQMLIFFLFFF